MIRGMFHGGQGQPNSCLALFFVYILVSAVHTKDVGIGYIWYVCTLDGQWLILFNNLSIVRNPGEG